MKFEEALAAMRAGHKVKRAKWGKYKYWCIGTGWCENQLLHCERKGEEPEFFKYGIKDHTILEEDWEICA